MIPNENGGYVITRDERRSSRARETQGPLQLRVVGDSVSLDLIEPSCTIGSGRQNQLMLRDRYVSRVHASLQWHHGRLWIQDRESRNGTWVNNLRVERCEVGPGARILVGHTCIQLVNPIEYGPTLGLVGQHPSMKEVYDKINKLGATTNPVLITGETGTGKELTARALHNASSCCMGPFEPLNCGAVPRDLAESEFFGHARGAYTGAMRERQGAFERAAGGTLFLDEIGELPRDLQPKILRTLEEGEIQRIGESMRRMVDTRIIAATNRDLAQESRHGRFRLDLFHRLAVGVIHLPPLRERTSDVPLLVQHFLRQCNTCGIQHKVSRKALGRLKRHSWPGNVRELRNAVCRATMEGGPDLNPEDFAFLNTGVSPDAEVGVPVVGRSMEEIKKDIFERTLVRFGGNRSAAAGALQVPKSTFFDQVRAMGLG